MYYLVGMAIRAQNYFRAHFCINFIMVFFFKFPLFAFFLHTGGWLFQNYQKHVINYILMTWFLDKKAQVIFLLKFSV